MSVLNRTAPRRLKILHLAFEDHRRPGSGGGGYRTHEINARLARHHDVTAVVSRYSGARRRVEDGVKYRPLGLPLGHFPSMIFYHLALPFYVFFHRADVVVEAFGAPHSSDLVPLWTRCPSVAVVQYLFAGEKSTQYHLPFWLPELLGVHLHRDFVTGSRHVANEIELVNPGARTEVVYAGVEPPHGERHERVDPNLLFMGRLEFDMKGLDHVVSTFSGLAEQFPALRLRIAGSGPDRQRVERALASVGLSGRVDFLGQLASTEKWEALRSATVVLMPSRFETFGLVALEAIACGAPLIGFAIPTLMEITDNGRCAVLVDLNDGDALLRATAQLLSDGGARARLARAALGRAANFDWERAAADQEEVYLKVASSRPPTRRWLFHQLLRGLRSAPRRRPRRSGRTGGISG